VAIFEPADLRADLIEGCVMQLDSDARRKLRRRVEIKAKLCQNRESPLRDCTVIDISDIGARLAVDSLYEIPQEFTLLLAPRGGPTRRCRLVWRSGGQAGVIFCERPGTSLGPLFKRESSIRELRSLL
jgi:hypothetical protein